MKKIVASAAAVALLTGALAYRSLAQDSQPKPSTDDTPCPLAHAKGGTIDVACKNDAKMAEYQGLDGKCDAKVAINWPKEDDTISDKDLEKPVDYELTGYDIGKDDEKGKFQHCHLILDDKPYVPDYDHKTTLAKLGGGKPIAEGTHLLTIFPARNFHLSLKNPGACAQIRFHVNKKDGDLPGPKDPQLIYSRPKGEYDADKGEMKALLIDFYLLNVPLTKGPKQELESHIVMLTITDADNKPVRKLGLSNWWPVVVELPAPYSSKYTITLDLQSAESNITVKGAFNKVSREITVKKAPEKK